MFLTTLGLLVERLALRATGGLSAGRSLALGPRVQAGQGQVEAWEGKKEEAALVLMGHTHWQTPGFWALVHMRVRARTHTHELSCTLLLPQHAEHCSHWLSHSEDRSHKAAGYGQKKKKEATMTVNFYVTLARLWWSAVRPDTNLDVAARIFSGCD